MALSIYSGSYTGNGSHPQTISGVGFTPKLLVISENPGGTLDEYAACWKSSDMSTGASGLTANMGENGQQTTGLIDTLNSDGFTVRGQKNLASTTYYFLALGGSDVVTGTYVGNATDNRAITGIGFKPAVMLLQGGNNHSMWKNTASGDSTDYAYYFTSLGGETDLIQSLDTDGFTVGARTNTGRQPNQNLITYYYACIAASSQIYSTTYTGNGSDDRSITGASNTPIAAWVKNTNNTYQARTRYAEAGDLSSFVRANNSPAANAIQAFESSGIQLGTDATVNGNGFSYVAQMFSSASSSAIKTINGLAKASVKTVNGLAIASVKSFNGLQ